MMMESCGLLLKISHEALEKRANNEFRFFHLTLTQVQFLLELCHSENESCTLKELGKNYQRD